MRRCALLLGLLLAALTLVLGGHARPAHATAYLFQDEFSGAAGASPDPAKWWVTPWCSNAADDAYDCFNPANCYQDGAGHLVMAVTPGTMGRPFDACRLQTFVEGKWPPNTVLWSAPPPLHIEWAVKEPPITDSHGNPAYGLISSAFALGTRGYSRGDPVLETDVQEFRSMHPLLLHCAAHGQPNWEWNSSTSFPASVNASAQYVAYWENYYPDRVDYGATVTTMYSFTTYSCGSAPFSPASGEELSPRIDNGVGVPGSWRGEGGPPAVETYLAYVDYVRAWAL